MYECVGVRLILYILYVKRCRCLIIYGWERRLNLSSDPLLEQLEELLGALEKTRQELDTTKLHLSSTQQSLHERDRHLNSLRQDRRKQLQEILEMKLVATFRVEGHLIPFLVEIAPFLYSHDELSYRNKRGPFCFATQFSLFSFGGCSSFCHGTAFL